MNKQERLALSKSREKERQMMEYLVEDASWLLGLLPQPTVGGMSPLDQNRLVAMKSNLEKLKEHLTRLRWQ